MTRALGELERAGVKLEERPPGFTLEAMNRVWSELFVLGSGVFMELMGVTLPVKAADAPGATPADWFRCLDHRDALIRQLETLLESFDAFLCPTLMTTAFAHSPPRTPILVDSVEVESRFVDHYLYPWNLTGNPALVIPTGVADDGLPVSVQLIGRRYRDEELLAVGRAVAEVTGGFRPPPLNSTSTPST
jgi:Asp-tRNA(Asn)/Glu-tRNA(Gln) amidotransferase A subunit family amidase